MANISHGYTDADPVVAQYERWVYPPPVDDLTKPAIPGYLETFQSLRNLAYAYWPAGPPREPMDILVAGCGSTAAACFAYLYPQSRVIGIDISRASLAHEQHLKERHHLANLSLDHRPLEEVAGLGAAFDYISCHGVLHHMSDPVGGLRALGQVLRRDGVIGLMLYGKYGRAQVYVFQELFRLLGLGQTPEDVMVVRETLAALPADHLMQDYLRRASDLKDDAILVDTFLHRRDRSYSVADCLALVRDAGLVFQGWDANLLYYPDARLHGVPGLRERLDALPDEQVWQAMELLAGSTAMHTFYACRHDRDPATYRIPWDSERLLDCMPLRGAELLRGRGVDGQPTWAMGRAPYPPVPLTVRQTAIFSHIDGRRTTRQCLAAAGVSGPSKALLEEARGLLRLMWRSGYGLIYIPSPVRA